MIEMVTNVAFALIGVAVVLVLIRIVRGPTLADRVVGLDAVTLLGISAIGIFAVRTGLYLYVDIAVALALLAFLSTAAFARFLLSRKGR